MKKLKRLLLALLLVCALLIAGTLVLVTRPSIQRNFILSQFEKHGIAAQLINCSISLTGDIEFTGLIAPLPQCQATCASGKAKISTSFLNLLFISLFNPSSTSPIKADISDLHLSGIELDFSKKTPPSKTIIESTGTAGTAGTDSSLTSLNISFTLTEANGSIRFQDGRRAFFKTEATGNFQKTNTGTTAFLKINTGTLSTPEHALLGNGTTCFSAHLTYEDTAGSSTAGSIAAGSSTAATTSTWKALLNNFSLTSATGKPLLTGKLSAGSSEAAAPLPISFSATLTAYADGFAAQPAFRELLAQAAAANWRADLITTGSIAFKETPITGIHAALNTTAPFHLLLKTADLNAHATAVRPNVSAGGMHPAISNSAAAPAAALRAILLRPFDSADPTGTINREISNSRSAVPPALLSLEAQNFALALATPFLAGAQIDGSVSGAFHITRDSNRLRIASVPARTITVRDLSFNGTTGKRHLDHLNIAGDASFSIEPHTAAWELDIRNAHVGTTETTEATGTTDKKNISASGSDSAISNSSLVISNSRSVPLTGSFFLGWDSAGLRTLRSRLIGDPALLLRQPLLGNCRNLASAKLNFLADYTRAGNCDFRLLLENIRATGDLSAGDLPTGSDLSTREIARLHISAIGNTAPKSLNLSVPLRLTGALRPDNSRSETDLLLRLSPATSASTDWTATLTGSQFDPADIALLASIFKSHKTKTEAEADAAKTDERPFWQSLGSGRLSAKIAKILLPLSAGTGGTTPTQNPSTGGSDSAISNSQNAAALADFTATLTLTPTLLEIPHASASFAGTPFDSRASLSFSPPATTSPHAAHSIPYSLQSTTRAHSLPLQKIIALAAPNEKAEPLTGDADVSVLATGTGINSTKLAKNITLKITADSAGGRIRLLANGNSTAGIASDIANQVGGVADIASDLLGAAGGGRHATAIKTLRNLQQYLDDFPYETLTLRATRAPDGAINVANFRVANTSIAVSAAGDIAAPDPAGDWSQSPLAFRARFCGKNEYADLLKTIKLAAREPDNLGYTVGPEFKFEGTPGALRNNLLETLLKNLRLNAKTITAPLEGLLPAPGRLLPF